MSRLSTFFHGADTQLSVFHPNGYTLAVYPSLGRAVDALEEFRQAGFAGEDLIAVSASEALEFAEDHFVRDGVWGVLMTGLSRAIGAGAGYTQDDLFSAHSGAGFLAVHCPTDRERTHAWELLQKSPPLAARHYSPAGIELLPGQPAPAASSPRESATAGPAA